MPTLFFSFSSPFFSLRESADALLRLAASQALWRARFIFRQAILPLLLQHKCSSTPFQVPCEFWQTFLYSFQKGGFSVLLQPSFCLSYSPACYTYSPLVTLSHWLLLDWDGFHVGISGCTVRSISALWSTVCCCQFRQEELVRAW